VKGWSPDSMTFPDFYVDRLGIWIFQREKRLVFVKPVQRPTRLWMAVITLPFDLISILIMWSLDHVYHSVSSCVSEYWIGMCTYVYIYIGSCSLLWLNIMRCDFDVAAFSVKCLHFDPTRVLSKPWIPGKWICLTLNIIIYPILTYTFTL